MRNPSFYVLLVILVVLDGWLLAHPNLIGRAGVFFFDYTYLETFLKAAATVASVVGVALVLTLLIGRLGRPIAPIVLTGLFAGAAFYTFQSFTHYNSGIYKLTGAGFRAGAILLPFLLVAVFGKALFDVATSKPVRR